MSRDVTQILNAIDRGDPRATEDLLPVVYEELRRLADARIANEHKPQTLQATALVHEAFLRLVGPDGSSQQEWDGRGHFFAAAAEAMRRILIEKARQRNAQKRGGPDARRVAMSSCIAMLEEDPGMLLELDGLIEGLKAEHPQAHELIKLRFYAGLSMAQSAEFLGVSLSTAERRWSFARAWLFSRLNEHG